MRIGVSGAGGQLGSAIVSELIVRGGGHEIVAISRSPDTVSQDVERRAGDYNRPDLLGTAYAGLDRLAIIPTMELSQEARAHQHLTAVNAACAGGVGHILFLSAVGTRDVAPPAVTAAYFPAEQALMRGARAWSILRMNYYIDTFIDEVRNSLLGGTLAGLAEHRAGFVARRDVAAAAAGILLGNSHAGAIYTATGPRLYTGAERCAAVANATGKPFEFAVLPQSALHDYLIQAGLGQPLAELLISLQLALAGGAFDIVTGDVERLAGRAPQTLEAALAEAFAPPL